MFSQIWIAIAIVSVLSVVVFAQFGYFKAAIITGTAGAVLFSGLYHWLSHVYCRPSPWAAGVFVVLVLWCSSAITLTMSANRQEVRRAWLLPTVAAGSILLIACS